MVTKNRFSPYDQAVLDDPAYETKPGPVSGFISDVIYGALTPEQELLQQIDQSKQLRSEATAKALQGTKYESFAGQSDLPSYVIQSPGIKERLDEAGYVFEPFQEGFGRIGQFIFGGQRKAFKKLSEGEKLTPDDINEIAFAPLDALDFIFPPLIIKRLARLGIKSVDDAIKSTIKDPDVDFVKERIGGGSGIPLGIRGTDDPLGVGDRTALAPDRNGTGGGPEIKVDLRKDPEKVEQIKATKIKKEQEELFEPYRQNLQDYLAQTNVPSAKGFYNYLLENNIPLTLEKLNVPGKSVIYKKPQERRNKNISTETEHLKKAVDYLTDGKSPLGEFRPEWTGIAEKILEGSDKKLSNSQIYDELIKAGVPESEITGAAGSKLQKIQEFTKKDYLSDAAKKNVVSGKSGFINVENLNKDLIAFRDKLAADPSLQGKGIGTYEKIGGRTLRSILGDYRLGGRRNEQYGDIISSDLIEEIRGFTKKPTAPPREGGIREYIPAPTKVETAEPGLYGSAAYPTALQKIGDAFRTNFKFLDPQTGEAVYDFTDLESFEKTARLYGIERVPTGAKDARLMQINNQEPILKLARDIEILQNKSGAFTKAQIQGYYNVINDSKKLSNYTNQRFREVIENNPELKKQLINEYTEYYTKFPKTELVIDPKTGKEVTRQIPVEELTVDDFINAANRTFDGHVSHIFTISDFPSAGKGLENVGDISNFVRTNYGVENIALQKRGENAVDAAIKGINKKLKTGADITDEIATLRYFDKLFTRKGMALYRRIDKEQLSPEVIEKINSGLGREGVAGTIADRTTDGKPIPDDIAEKFNDIFIGSEQPLTLEQNIARFDELMDYYIKNPQNLKVSKSSKPQRKDIFVGTFPETPYFKRGFIDTALAVLERETRFKKGGISMVKGGMAIGGQNFTENMNKQDFTPDPGIEGISAFDQAVQSGNLQALNIPKIFKGLGEAFGVYSPKKVGKPLTGDMSAVTPVAKSDFPLQSFTFEKIINSKTQAARPQDWINELQGGAAAPKAELLDSGLFQYLADFEKFFPNQKISKQKLVDFLEDNPISNLKVKIKQSETGDPQYDSYMGRPRHEKVGSARMDKAATDYREVVIEAGRLPGQKEGEEFVNSSHFAEKNVLAFGRVGTYKNSAGDNVAVIQEMQTDYLTQVRKEQELLDAEIQRLTADKTKFEQRLSQATSEYDRMNATERLNEIDSKLPKLLKLQESKLIKPYPNIAAADLIPVYNKQLQDIQKNINDLSMQGVRRENPEFLMQINKLEQDQKQVLDALLDLNRTSDYEKLSEGVKIPDISDRENLLRYIGGEDTYVSMKNIKTFPPTPLNSQADYVDAIIKAVIKDAENRGINKIAIMPADVGANARWSKDSEDAKKKFRNLYDKVGVQQLKNIAKKYGGTVQEEFILDTTKGELGLRFLNKNVDGEFQVLKETDIDPSVTIRREDLGPSKPPEGLNAFLNEEILRVAKDYGPNEVVFRKEIAPGQTMEYFVNVKQGDVVDQKFDLVPLGDADRAENATIIIEEYNPQRVKMNVLVLPESNKDKPMYLFKKKKGGIMPDDRLVSITDIYGDY